LSWTIPITSTQLCIHIITFVVYTLSPTFKYFHKPVTIASRTLITQPHLTCCLDLVWFTVTSPYDVPSVWEWNENSVELGWGWMVGGKRWWSHSTELLQLFLHLGACEHCHIEAEAAPYVDKLFPSCASFSLPIVSQYCTELSVCASRQVAFHSIVCHIG
jgi:hypothetical protein